MPNPQGKNWVFTLNNYTEHDVDALIALGTELQGIKYLIFAKEVGESGTPHLQGYVSLAERKRLPYLKDLIGTAAHLEIARGSPAQAAAYCKKDTTETEDIYEYGTLPGGKGSRTDLMAVCSSIQEGKSLKRLAQDHPQAYIRYSKGIRSLRQQFITIVG